MDALLGDGVRISPSIVEFFDAESQVIHQMHISVQNLSKTSKVIRFLPPISDKFRVQCKELEKTIAPGLHLKALVEYFNDVEEDCEDHVVFMIGDNFVEVPLISYAPKPILAISGSVDFGTTVADGQVFTKEIAILNHGTKCGDFKILPDLSLPFHVTPVNGTVNPGYSQPIRFEFISKKVGSITAKLKCELKGQKENFIEIKANVVKRSLYILPTDSDKEVDCINFGSTYYGTDVVRPFWLYNSSPYNTSFVAVLEDGSEGEELGVERAKSLIRSYSVRGLERNQVDPSTLVSATPCQGVLSPFQRLLVYFKFSPRFIKPTKGWKHEEKSPPREDYAIFMRIQAAMTVSNEANEDMNIDLALTGTALPVVMSILPSPVVKFDGCAVGGTEESCISLRNDSVDLPICYAVRKVAHFHAFPVCGYVEVNQIKDLSIVFQPHQLGEFKCQLLVDIIGEICDMDKKDQPIYKKAVMETRVIHISGKASSTPLIKQSSKNKVSSYGEESPLLLKTNTSFLNSSSENATSVNSTARKSKNKVVKIAHPDDRASSIRPSNRKEIYRTKFTKQNRYSYVDPDYSFTDEESAKRVIHQKKYEKLLADELHNRKQKKTAEEFEKVNNETDLGMKPGLGLKPSKITVKEIIDAENTKIGDKGDTDKAENRLLSSKVVDEQRNNARTKKALEGLKAVPSTLAEKEACNSELTPQELFQIMLEPTLIDFGDVCRKSVCSRELKIVNNINKIISMQIDINCRELRQTSPISQVIPAGAAAKLEFIFESAKLGKFERSVNYVVNGKHKSHLVVHANVVTVGLELSTPEVSLQSAHGMPAESGLRKCVTLINKRNMPAEFSWSPIVKDGGTSFTIRPAKGIVEPFTNLECEVVFYPSYSSSFYGEFIVSVEHGNDLSLHCSAQIGPTSCSFVERRLMFGALPLNLTTIRSAFLRNTSNNHAYFKVADEHPLQGMVIRPKEGVVPVGGVTELLVSYKPELIHKFDTQVDIDILGWKMISLRMGGHVEVPSVDVDISDFNFGGIFCGAQASIPFKITNLGRSNAQVMFNLAAYKDFKVVFIDQTLNENIHEDKGYFNVYISGQDQVDAFLQFVPTEVASYDFVLPVSVNHQDVPSPPPSPYPSSAVTRTHGPAWHVNSTTPTIINFPTPSRRVQGTGLRSPLQLSTKCVAFRLPSTYFDLNILHPAGRVKSILFINNSTDTLKWSLDIDACRELFETNIFAFLFKKSSAILKNVEDNKKTITMESGQTYELNVAFNPGEARRYEVTVPVILNDDKLNPYSFIHLSGELMSSSLHFIPSNVVFSAVPLHTEVVAEVKIVGKNFNSDTPLDVEVPQIQLEDGSLVDVLYVAFDGGNNIIRRSSSNLLNDPESTLKCNIVFTSKLPVTFSSEIVFSYRDERYLLPVQGTADNCLLTCFNFLCNSQNDFHIICERAHQTNRESCANISQETVFIPCVSPIRIPTSVSMATNSTPFSLHSSSCDDSSMNSATTTSSDGRSPALPTAVEVDEFSPYEYVIDNIAESDTDEWRFLKDTMKTVQRWYSSQCWSNCYYPVVLPYSLRNCFTTVSCGNSTSRAGSWKREVKKQTKNIIDIIAHLCGKPVPGLPTSVALSPDIGERLRCILFMYSSLLTFLRCQGAMVSTIKPEYLLDHHDYHYHVMMMRKESKWNSSNDCDEDRYEFLSRKAWTELLLQVIKVLVLARVTPQSFKKMPLPTGYPPLPIFNPDPLCSNVYSVPERIILAWVNHHFEQQRGKCWRAIFDVPEPASRWIVNFENDFIDGLVLASLLAAYSPYVVKSHLHAMCTHANSAEQCLHNTLKVVDAFRFLGLDFDVLATDITEPNAVGILLLCAYLYQRLPQYLPKSNVDLTGSLHSVVSKHVKLQNPSNKPLVYEAVIAGDYASDFRLPAGCHVQVPAKGSIQLLVEYKSRFLRACDATLVLVGKRVASAIGSTLVFNLRGSVDTIIPSGIIKCVSPCYELKKLNLTVKNPFSKGGNFKIILAETNKSDNNNPFSKPKTRKSLKMTASKTDHGQNKQLSSPKRPIIHHLLKNLEAQKNDLILSAFWAPSSSIKIDALAENGIEVQFLPFHVGSLQCSVLLLDEKIGEFLYSIEAESSLPLPSMVPFRVSGKGLRVTSATAVLHSQGLLKDDNRIIYLHCEAQKESLEEMLILANNKAKEKALVLAAKQRMSEKELKRREITGIMSSDTVLSAVASLQINNDGLSSNPSELLGISGHSLDFTVELTSPYFKAPKTLRIVLPDENEADMDTIKLPITVLPSPPGQYPCSVILAAQNDIRVYHIECTIKHSNVTVELEFTSPTHEAILQNVPVINHSDIDWNLEAEIAGEGFSGPNSFLASRQITCNYPLSFKPIYEGVVEGFLVLRNKSNGAENKFHLIGNGIKPLALGNIHIDCIVNETTMKVVKVTNDLNHKIVFQTFSNLDMITGPAFITVLPKRTVQVPLTVRTKKRGCIEGLIMFIHDSEYNAKLGLDRTLDYDSDEEVEDHDKPSVNSLHVESFYMDSKPSKFADLSQSERFRRPYRLWYSITINSIPGSPEKRLEVSSPLQETSTMELQLKNPLDIDLKMNVIINGKDLYGEPFINIPPSLSVLYQLHYEPTTIGASQACVIFQGGSLVEFWYDIRLIAEQPLSKTLPSMQCVLGRSCSQSVMMHNPTKQPIVYRSYCSNEVNFNVDCISNEISVPAMSSTEITVTFYPSAVGAGNHTAEINFENAQVGCQTFMVSGIGEAPAECNDHVIQVELGGNASTIIVFYNPFDHDIIVDIDLKQKLSNGDFVPTNDKDSEFNLLLKVWNNLVLPSKAVIDVPISYAPGTMDKCEAMCTISTRPFTTLRDKSSDEHRDELLWIYNIQGIPLAIPLRDSDAPVLECRARERSEEKMEISFIGSGSGGTSEASTNARYPINFLGQYVPPASPDIGLDYQIIANEFEYHFQYDDMIIENDIGRSLALMLRRTTRCKSTGLVTLLFDIILAPSKSFNHLVRLVITSPSGGVWKYPIRLKSDKPIADDLIVIESAGLNKESVVSFRMSNQTNKSSPFEAYFANGSDPMFTVSPPNGTLSPINEEGTLISVCYKPTYYGKVHQGKLLIQTRDCQWMYQIKGVTPEYQPPQANAATENRFTGKLVQPRKHNFVRDNLRVIHTGVSSPLKGAGLLKKYKGY